MSSETESETKTLFDSISSVLTLTPVDILRVVNFQWMTLLYEREFPNLSHLPSPQTGHVP